MIVCNVLDRYTPAHNSESCSVCGKLPDFAGHQVQPLCARRGHACVNDTMVSLEVCWQSVQMKIAPNSHFAAPSYYYFCLKGVVETFGPSEWWSTVHCGKTYLAVSQARKVEWLLSLHLRQKMLQLQSRLWCTKQPALAQKWKLKCIQQVLKIEKKQTIKLWLPAKQFSRKQCEKQRLVVLLTEEVSAEAYCACPFYTYPTLRLPTSHSEQAALYLSLNH